MYIFFWLLFFTHWGICCRLQHSLTSSHGHLLGCFLQSWSLTTDFAGTFCPTQQTLSLCTVAVCGWSGISPPLQVLLRAPHQKARNGDSGEPCEPYQCMAAPILPASFLLFAGGDGAASSVHPLQSCFLGLTQWVIYYQETDWGERRDCGGWTEDEGGRMERTACEGPACRTRLIWSLISGKQKHKRVILVIFIEKYSKAEFYWTECWIHVGAGSLVLRCSYWRCAKNIKHHG